MDHLQPNHFSPRLHDLISNIPLQPLSRIPSARLQTTALPNIGLLELVSATAFHQDYETLYTTMFHGNERERPDLIVDRLADDFAGRRAGLAPYRVVGIRDPKGEAIAGAQFSVLMLRGEGGGGVEYAVPYVQYIYVRPENRRQDLSEVLHTLVLAVAAADAQAAAEGKGTRRVPFTLFETEPPGHGVTASSQSTATERTMIHARSGSRAVMLRPTGSKDAEGVCSAHVQPGLEPKDGPLTLVWAIRPSPAATDVAYDVQRCGEALVAAYYRSLRDEGFPEPNIALAERIVAKRVQGREFFEMPLADVTAAMYKDIG